MHKRILIKYRKVIINNTLAKFLTRYHQFDEALNIYDKLTK